MGMNRERNEERMVYQTDRKDNVCVCVCVCVSLSDILGPHQVLGFGELREELTSAFLSLE
jgi:hypothetical protein